MNLKRLEYFLVVAEQGSISLAAQRLHMTQPPLSQAILGLESELGVKLLTRLPRGVEPTPAGRLLLEQGRQLLRWADRIAMQVNELGSGRAGRLHIAAVPTFSWSHLPPLLQAFGTEVPGVEVELSDPEPSEVLRAVADGGADVGFVATADPAVVAAAYPGLNVKPLVAMRLGLAVQAGRGSMDIGDFADAAWIVPTAVPGFPGLQDAAQKLWDMLALVPRSVQHVSTLQTALPLVAAGMGVSLMPRAVLDVVAGGVELIELSAEVLPLYGTMVWSADIGPSPTLERFLEVVERTYAG